MAFRTRRWLQLCKAKSCNTLPNHNSWERADIMTATPSSTYAHGWGSVFVGKQELAMESRSQMLVDQREISEHRISFDRQTNALHQPEEESVRLQSLLSPAATVGPCICVCKAKDFSFKDEELLVGTFDSRSFSSPHARRYTSVANASSILRRIDDLDTSRCSRRTLPYPRASTFALTGF